MASLVKQKLWVNDQSGKIDNNVKWLGWLHGLNNKSGKIISLVNDQAWPV